MSGRLPLIAEGSRPLRWRSAFEHQRRTTPGWFVQFPFTGTDRSAVGAAGGVAGARVPAYGETAADVTARFRRRCQLPTCEVIQSRLACMFCCHSYSRRATILASFAGWALIAGLSPDGLGPILAHRRISLCLTNR
jgi:hypothetical protein